jgi:hypothetical protein
MINIIRDRDERIAKLELALKRLNLWFDTDQEIIDGMDSHTRADHILQHNRIKDALK